MTTAKLVKTLKTLKYFDSNFKVDQAKIDTLEKGDSSKQQRLLRELKITSKYVTVHYYTLLNDKTLHTPQEFRFLITKAAERGEDVLYISRFQRKLATLTEQEFKTYLEAHAELQQNN